MTKRNDIAARLALGSIMLMVPACHLPCLRDASSSPALPAAYSTTPAESVSTENSSQINVDDFFQDPLLSSLIHQAASDNRELKILNEEIEVARNEILARRGAYLPFLGFGARAGLEKPSRFTPQGAVEDQLQFEPGRPFPDPLPNFLVGLDVFWQLDIWRELRNARDAANQRYFAAVEQRNSFVTKMVSEVAENYYRLMALDQRLDTLNQTIILQQKSLELAKSRKDAGRGTELGVQRFEAEVRKNESEKLIVQQDMIEAENRINTLLNRYPQTVNRATTGFLNLTIQTLQVGVPAQLLQYRPDIRQAERELLAAGLDVKVARAHFYPRVDLGAGVGYEALNPRYIFFTPESLIYNVVGNLTVPLINRAAIKAEYQTANAKQLQAVYHYQQVIVNAFVEVVNRISMAENFGKSIELKKQQLAALEASVETSTKLFENARVEYVEVLLAQRDMMEARLVLIDTKKEQLGAIVKAYQALGGGNLLNNAGATPSSANCE